MDSLLDTTEFFSGNGPLARLLPGYAERSEQRQLAEAIEKALEENVSLVCEAGTGTGKTFAYLMPVLQSGKKVIISTGTRHLQDQLYYRDLPVISRALSLPIHTSLLKGRANYLCLHRLETGEKDNRTASTHTQSDFVTLRRWLNRTESGDLGEITELPEQAPVKSLVTSTTENCLGQSCDYYNDCFVFRARRRAIDADVVVVNHHLLLSDLALRESGFGEVLPKADYIIFDEAHQLPELATEFFGMTVSSRQLQALAEDCRLAWNTDAADVKGLPELLDSLLTIIRQVRLAFGFEDTRKAWGEASGQKAVSKKLDELIKCLAKLESLLDKLSSRSRALENCWIRCSQVIARLEEFCERETTESIQWLEVRGQGFQLHQTPLDISGVFQSRLSRYECECIYTSATLAVNGDFSHFRSQLGLEDITCRSWESPFDFQKQALLYLPDGLPQPSERGYTEAVIDTALPVIRSSEGHAFLLFTSHRALQTAAEYIKSRLDYPVLVQGDAPRSELLEVFRNTQHAVLLGTSSFWEGVDVKGQALSCVVIDKLPFAPPDDPVFRARAGKMQEQGVNPFLDYQLPQAIIALKQGVGRLIRDVQDYGVLMICDPRIRSKSYGRKFIRSLPEMPVTSDPENVVVFFRERQPVN